MYDYMFPRAEVFNQTAPGADADILATALTPFRHGTMRVTAAVATSGILNVTIKQGSTTLVESLNSGSPLAAGCLYTFVFGCNPKCAYNFQVHTNSNIDYLQVEESNLGAL